MQGGLVQSGQSSGRYHTMATGTGPPDATGVPELPQSDGTAPAAGAGRGVTVSVDTSQMGPVDTLLTGTSWTRQDVDLVLQGLSTAILVYWALTEAA